ncbi:hypothetical protein [Streptomyces sp. NBC_00503]|uniref:hypothetical protein n=1 Tax=Streptomyces sp. NBC_00503 TaxID=2903659 RepID=UPI002E817858|nr:hypothetical protein [Streptomyces sp. NBC_00503]WUD82142.1 hypothetical protein OG490_17210 [Streptomyces sp. NBC_00503]
MVGGRGLAKLRHLANAPRGRYRLACTVTFNHHREEWLDRATANRSVRYDITYAPERGRWYLVASWSTPKAPLPTPAELAATDARATGRETMGRGKRGKSFRRTVAGLPTARFRDRLSGMAHHSGLAVIAVDPAYTSRWGAQHWKQPLQQQSKTTIVTGHHAAAVAIGRRALGHGTRRRPGVTAHDQRIVGRRATGQAVTVPRARGNTSPPRTTGTPHPGDKTCRDRSDQLALFPVSQDRSGRQPASPAHSDSANTGRHR